MYYSVFNDTIQRISTFYMCTCVMLVFKMVVCVLQALNINRVHVVEVPTHTIILHNLVKLIRLKCTVHHVHVQIVHV